MPESFLQLPRAEQSEIYRALAPTMARSPTVLEKDVWVCWALKTLFAMPGRGRMAFKGGTSLSKVYRAIERFSEDVDITLDYRGIDANFDPFSETASRSQRKRFSDALKIFVREHISDRVEPHFTAALADQFGSGAFRVEIEEDGEQLRLHYPTAVEASGGYIGQSVLLEFGGRNITEPSREHSVRPDIAAFIDELEFPESLVNVLSPERTFWEKATLIHVECHRGRLEASSSRMSRHWYDLAMLAGQTHGYAALADRALLTDVVRHKQVFYNASYARYDECLRGGFKLVPEAKGLGSLRLDYAGMIESGMFIGAPPDFDDIIDRLRALEAVINA